MNKKRAGILFIIGSIIFLTSLLGIYTYRLIHYYQIEHPKNTTPTETKNLVQLIKAKLYEEDNIYYYKGNITDNYVEYSGQLWRILKVNEDETITLVHDSLVTTLVQNKNETWQDSTLAKWLNETYLPKLKEASTYLVPTKLCIDAITDSKKITCENNETTQVGILSITDYQKASGSNGFLNSGENYWLSNPYQDNATWYITTKGTIASASEQALGVKPVITLKSEIPVLSGDGTENNPYTFLADSGTTLQEKEPGKYVSFSNMTFRIIDQTETGTVLALDGYITDEEPLEMEYSSQNNTFNPKRKNTLAYYLNNTYYQSLELHDAIIDGIWHTGTYNQDNDYQINTVLVSTTNAKIGLLKVGDLFINDYDSYSLLTGSEKEGTTIYTVKKEGKLYEDVIGSPYKIRPAITLKGDITILGGTGHQNDPYQLNLEPSE